MPPGVSLIAVRCPVAVDARFGVDDRGRVHVLVELKGGAGVVEVSGAVDKLTRAVAWWVGAVDYAARLPVARTLDLSRPPMMHLIADEGAVSGRVGRAGIQVHVRSR